MYESEKIERFLKKNFTYKDNEYCDGQISVFIDCEAPYIIESGKNESQTFKTLKKLRKLHNKYKEYYANI